MVILKYDERRLGFAIDAQITQEEINRVMDRLLKTFPDGGVKVAFSDLTITSQLWRLIQTLERQGFIMARFIDHHYKEAKQHESQLRDTFTEGVRLMPRNQAPSSTRLVYHSEWIRRDVRVVFVDSDPDGFFSLIKGWGLWGKYLQEDADFIDSKNSSYLKGRRKLTEMTSMLLNGFAYYVPFNSHNSTSAALAIQDLWQTIIDWLRDGEKPTDCIVEMLQEVERLKRLDREWAKEFIAQGTYVSEYRMLICAWPSEIGEFSYQTWKSLVHTAFPAAYLLGRDVGSSVLVELAGSCDGCRCDMRSICQGIEDGVQVWSRKRAVVSKKFWERFLRQWQTCLFSSEGNRRFFEVVA